jgi:hypothetical protein
MDMRKWITVLILGMLFIVFGCATASQNTPIKCPKCGAFFSTKEGAETFQWMREPRETRK